MQGHAHRQGLFIVNLDLLGVAESDMEWLSAPVCQRREEVLRAGAHKSSSSRARQHPVEDEVYLPLVVRRSLEALGEGEFRLLLEECRQLGIVPDR